MSAAEKPALRFDEKEHRYFLGERELPGVTSRLKLAGMIEDGWFNEKARDRGTAVHYATEYDDLGILKEETLDERAVPYLEAWRAFRRETGWENVEFPELPVCSPTLGYATKIDRVGNLRGKLSVLNLKTGQRAPWHGAQLAGEAIAYCEWRGLSSTFKVQRLSLYLANDGTYRLHVHENRIDFERFKAAVVIAAWKEEVQ